jgi:hypothetical protein
MKVISEGCTQEQIIATFSCHKCGRKFTQTESELKFGIIFGDTSAKFNILTLCTSPYCKSYASCTQDVCGLVEDRIMEKIDNVIITTENCSKYFPISALKISTPSWWNCCGSTTWVIECKLCEQNHNVGTYKFKRPRLNQIIKECNSYRPVVPPRNYND